MQSRIKYFGERVLQGLAGCDDGCASQFEALSLQGFTCFPSKHRSPDGRWSWHRRPRLLWQHHFKARSTQCLTRCPRCRPRRWCVQPLIRAIQTLAAFLFFIHQSALPSSHTSTNSSSNSCYLRWIVLLLNLISISTVHHAQGFKHHCCCLWAHPPSPSPPLKPSQPAQVWPRNCFREVRLLLAHICHGMCHYQSGCLRRDLPHYLAHNDPWRPGSGTTRTLCPNPPYNVLLAMRSDLPIKTVGLRVEGTSEPPTPDIPPSPSQFQ